MTIILKFVALAETSIIVKHACQISKEMNQFNGKMYANVYTRSKNICSLKNL